MATARILFRVGFAGAHGADAEGVEPRALGRPRDVDGDALRRDGGLGEEVGKGEGVDARSVADYEAVVEGEGVVEGWDVVLGEFEGGEVHVAAYEGDFGDRVGHFGELVVERYFLNGVVNRVRRYWDTSFIEDSHIQFCFQSNLMCHTISVKDMYISR